MRGEPASVRACTYLPRLVSTVKISRFINTSITILNTLSALTHHHHHHQYYHILSSLPSSSLSLLHSLLPYSQLSPIMTILSVLIHNYYTLSSHPSSTSLYSQLSPIINITILSTLTHHQHHYTLNSILSTLIIIILHY